jgi:hypothetical protein
MRGDWGVSMKVHVWNIGKSDFEGVPEPEREGQG